MVLFPCCFVMSASSSLRRALIFCKEKQKSMFCVEKYLTIHQVMSTNLNGVIYFKSMPSLRPKDHWSKKVILKFELVKHSQNG